MHSYRCLINLLYIGTLVVLSAEKITGYGEWKVSPEEARAVEKLLPMVEKYLTQDFMKTEIFLLPFLRTKKLNINEAKQMVLRTMEWRKEHNIDNILQENLDLEKQLPYDFSGFDFEGRPVGIVRIGQWDARRIVLSAKVEQAKRVAHKILETARSKTVNISKELNKNITQAVAIFDLSGYSIRQHACLQCVPIYLEILITFDSHYPQLAKGLIGVNTPKIFQALLDVISPAFSDYTRKTLKFFGFDRVEWSKYLLSIIPEDQLPKYLSGTKNTRK